MGSIVIDAVNHFFNPHHSSPPTEGQPQSAQSPPQYPDTSDQPLRNNNSRLEASRPSNSDFTTTSMSVTGSEPRTGQLITSPHRDEDTKAHPATPQSRQTPSRPTINVNNEAHGSGERDAPSETRESSPASASSASGSSGAPSVSSDESSSPPTQRIKVKDLAHIQSLADNDTEAFSDNGQGFRQKSGDQGPQYEISGMPIEHIIEMVAGLLTKITTANDMQHEHLHRQMPAPDSSTTMSAQTNSVLAFHGKNVPSITILSYLNRINKYCPTSYEVFLSLLVYFDRMTEKVNSGPIQNLRELNQHATERNNSLHAEGVLTSPASTQSMEGVTSSGSGPAPSQVATPPMSAELEKHRHKNVPGTPHSKPRHPESPVASLLDADALNLSHFFVVDSFNIHRLVIAGVTCASKFFSDIFYTNSRYAKVGGLPLPELNHLELQFLLLNDFRLSIPVEEMEAYGTMLVEFYAREVLIQRQAERAEHSGKSSASNSNAS